MNKLINELKKKSFSGKDILDAVNGKTKIIIYNQLFSIDSLEKLFYPHNCFVLLYETRPNYGHWVCLIKHNENLIEFFDPYSYFIDDQINFIKDENFKPFPILSELLYNSGCKIIYNNVQLQKLKKDVSSCGRHVALRIALKHLPLDEYVKLIKSANIEPDNLITYLTAFI